MQQSTRTSELWTVDPAWTGQVEMTCVQQVETTGLEAIKAQREGNLTHQQLGETTSTDSDMPPKTRSQTTRSRPPNPSSVTTLEDELRNLDVRSRGAGPVRSSSGDSESDHAGETGGVISTTPKCRKIVSSVHTTRRQAARQADPNKGRCLITNRPFAVEVCHVVAKSTPRTTITRLEYAWGLEYDDLHLDTRYNLLHLRADWHFLFDDSKWILVPELEIIQRLKKIYVTDNRPRSDLSELLTDTTYNYHVIPVPWMQEVICHFPDVNSHEHTAFVPPYTDLGSLPSHIRPQFAIFNACEKIIDFDRGQVAEMGRFLSGKLSTTFQGASPLDDMIDLYRRWTRGEVPAEWRNRKRTSGPSHPPGQGRQGNPFQGGPPPRREGLRSATRSQGQGTQDSAGHHGGGYQRAMHPFRMPEEDDSSSVTDDTIVEDDTAWIEYIHNWQKQDENTTEIWEQGTLNDSSDEQLVAYNNEHARTPPSPGAWDSWKPAWDSRTSQDPTSFDRSRFSSNDWAVFRNDVYLARPEYP